MGVKRHLDVHIIYAHQTPPNQTFTCPQVKLLLCMQVKGIIVWLRVPASKTRSNIMYTIRNLKPMLRCSCYLTVLNSSDPSMNVLGHAFDLNYKDLNNNVTHVNLNMKVRPKRILKEELGTRCNGARGYVGKSCWHSSALRQIGAKNHRKCAH